MAPRLRALALLLLLALAASPAAARRLRSRGDPDSDSEAYTVDPADSGLPTVSGDPDSESEAYAVDPANVGVPPADTAAAAAFPDDPTDGTLAPTFDVPEGQDDADFVMGAVPVDEGEAAGYASAGAAPPDDGTAHGGAPSQHGCHAHASWADFDYGKPYQPALHCPKGWRTATSDSDRQRVKALLDDAFYSIVLPQINWDRSKKAQAFKCDEWDVVSLHHSGVAGCIEQSKNPRMIVQGTMKYVCWGSRQEMKVGEKAKGTA